MSLYDRMTKVGGWAISGLVVWRDARSDDAACSVSEMLSTMSSWVDGARNAGKDTMF